MVRISPLYSDEFSRTDTYNKDGIIRYRTGQMVYLKIQVGSNAHEETQHNKGLDVTKPVSGFPAKLVSNQSPQLQRLARKLEFYL